MNTWFTVKVKYTKTLDDGKSKRVTEAYLLDAVNFTDAEARATEEIGAYIQGEFEVVSITRTPFMDIFTNDEADTWYKCKVTYEDLVDDKPKKVTENYLVHGMTVKDADANLKAGLAQLMVDYEIKSIVETSLLNIFKAEHSTASISI